MFERHGEVGVACALGALLVMLTIAALGGGAAGAGPEATFAPGVADENRAAAARAGVGDGAAVKGAPPRAAPAELDELSTDALARLAAGTAGARAQEEVVVALRERREGLGTLLALLGDDERDVRLGSATAIARLRDGAALPGLRIVLDRERDRDVHAALVRAVESLSAE